ncbi:MAG: hypothetical protein GKR98_16120 [Boseongicola sp.]|nr:MAG: hypothetical protein GKR98_16120 [Boseongicola sp.]
MAIRLIANEVGSNFLLVDVAQSGFRLSDQPFFVGLMHGTQANELGKLSQALLNLAPIYKRRATETEKWFSLSSGLPGGNQFPQIQYRGVYPREVSISSGSQKLTIIWASAITVMSGVANYPSFKDGWKEIQSDLKLAVSEIHNMIVRPTEDDEAPMPVKMFDIAEAATLERRVIDELNKRAEQEGSKK